MGGYGGKILALCRTICIPPHLRPASNETLKKPGLPIKDLDASGMCMYHETYLLQIPLQDQSMRHSPEASAVLKPLPDQISGKSYGGLYRRFVLLTLVCSALPLLLVGWIIYIKYATFSNERMVDYFQRKVEYNRRIIELFVGERTRDLELLGSTHSLDYLREQANLEKIFAAINKGNPYFEDLGVISDRGFHLSYVGPYDLMSCDYSETFWFRGLKQKGIYVSDMFMGYRKVPHFIIALLRNENGRNWIFRATVFTEALNALVESMKLGHSGEIFLLNEQGVYQTNSRSGARVMDTATISMDYFKTESGIRLIEPENLPPPAPPIRQVMAYSWLKEPRWLLVVKQDYDEVFRDVNHANFWTLVFLHVSVLAILIVSIVTTRHMIKVIRRRDEEAEELNRQLLHASKLASVGQLAAGVAHEINNPLAVIMTENQIIRDLGDDMKGLDDEFKEELFDSLARVDSQVERCATITQSLLTYSRRTKSARQTFDLNESVKETLALMNKWAGTSGIAIVTDLEERLPLIDSDRFKLEQVLVNLVGNALDAHQGMSCGTIRVATRLDSDKRGVEITVADTGIGIPPENLDKIFDPFFSTKPSGKGTGLGLSITLSIVKELGGDITVRSTLGEGSEFRVSLPLESSADHDKNSQPTATDGEDEQNQRACR